MKELPCAAEVVVVNDGSSDNTLAVLINWANDDSRIKVIGLARNFGHQAAVTAGLDQALGEAIVVLDSDLQDPPEVIPLMLAKYREGYDVVYGRRTSRDGETIFKRFTAWLFYRLMKWFVYEELPSDAGDFRLVSRQCVESLKAMRESHRFLRGMIAWVGFAQTFVDYERAPRAAGSTKYPLLKMLKFAWTAAVSFSPIPLRLSLAAGVLVAIGGFAYEIFALIHAMIVHDTVPGWASVITVTCVIGSAILISIGILGEYIARIFEATKGRPLYIISTSVNVAGHRTPDQQQSISSPAATPPVI